MQNARQHISSTAEALVHVLLRAAYAPLYFALGWQQSVTNRQQRQAYTLPWATDMSSCLRLCFRDVVDRILDGGNICRLLVFNLNLQESVTMGTSRRNQVIVDA